MKGVLLSGAPKAQLVDITHRVPPFQFKAAAWILASVYQTFPAGTVHLAIVDPGVGGVRRAIILKAAEQWFVGPDNGLFSLIIRDHPQYQAYEIKMISEHTSRTFQGRDLFAPMAAYLASKGVPGRRVKPLTEIRKFKENKCKKDAWGQWRGQIVAVDHFGNAITNLPAALTTAMRHPCLQAAGQRITCFRRTYSEGARSQAMVVIGSQGYLEIAVPEASAAKIMHLHPGLAICLKDEKSGQGKARK